MKTEYLIIISILGWGIGSLFYRPANATLNPIIVSAIVSSIYIILIPFAFLFLNFDRSINLPGIGYAALAGLFTCLGSLGYFFALRNGQAGEITAITAVYPAVTLLLSCIFFGESLTLRKVIGISLALTSVAVISWK